MTLAVTHTARNNISAEQHTAITRRMGDLPVDFDGLGATEDDDEQGPIYRCKLVVQKDVFAVRAPLRGDGPDTLFNRPFIAGVETAIVVGLKDPVFTDRDNRIRLQFHWQRGTKSSHRLEHPAGSNAPGDQSAGTWVRMASSAANVNSGDVHVARVGQEALVAFIEGDPDRPVCIGMVYSGRGAENSAGNQVTQGPSGATGNAPSWFAGSEGGHAHSAVLTGFKTQSMDSSQSAGGGYNQLVFDDTPGESRISLGTTSSPDKSAQSTWLNLGHLIHQADNQRLGKRGHGLELFTTAQGALRAGSGLHISAYAQAGGTQGKVHSLEARDAAGQIEYGQQISQSLLTQAAQHNAALPATDDKTGKVAGPSQPGIKDLPIVTQQDALLKSISSVASAVGEDGGNGSTPAWENPDIVISAPGGIASSTPMHAIYAAGTSVGLVSGQDVNVNAMRDFSTSVESGISLFTFGQVPSGATRPVKTTGMQLHAASGSVSVRANAHQVTAQADGNIKVSSSKSAPPSTCCLLAGAARFVLNPTRSRSQQRAKQPTVPPTRFSPARAMPLMGLLCRYRNRQQSRPACLR